MSNEEKANISINNDEASTSKIERIGSSQSFCSKSSTSSINLCVNLLSKNSIEPVNDKETSNTRTLRSKTETKPVFPNKVKQSPLIPNSIKEKLSELYTETHSPPFLNLKSSYSKNTAILNKVNRMKTIFQKENIGYSFPTAPSIINDNQLQKKARKMLIGLKSKQLEVEADIEEFKNQLDNTSSHKKNPFGLRDFEMKFKKHMKKNSIGYRIHTLDSNTKNGTFYPNTFMKI